MNHAHDKLIDKLAAELKPVRPLRARDGLALAGLGVVAAVLAVWLFAGQAGLEPDGLETGFFWPFAKTWPSEFFWIVNAMLILTGVAASLAVVAMALPHVGNRREGARWASAALAVLPLAALIALSPRGALAAALGDPLAPVCTAASLATGALVAAFLVAWLRHGAPVSLPSAGWLTGVAAGALGTAAYGLACPADQFAHLAIWHVVPVGIASALGRLVVPPLVRW